MTLIVDTAPIVSLADRRDPLWVSIERTLESEPGRLIVPAPVTAEIDYFLSTRHGDRASRRFVEDIIAGKFEVESLDVEDYSIINELSLRYADLSPGLVDLSIVVLAARFRTLRILTFDHRHFRAIRPLQGGSFILLPADEPPAGR